MRQMSQPFFWNAAIYNKNCRLRMQNILLMNAGNIFPLVNSVYVN